jgi:hypothetical protein
MEITAYSDFLAELAERDGLELTPLQPQAITDIHALERALGRDLPEAYEHFLHEVGAGELFGGLAVWYHADITMPGNLKEVSETFAEAQEEARRMRGGGQRLPKGFLPIYDAFEGEVFGLLPESKSRYGQAVYSWDCDELALTKVAEDFYGFLDFLAQSEGELPA